MSTEEVKQEEVKAESMDDYKDDLEKSFRRVEVGDIITGTVIDVTEEAIYVDLKYYAQGVIPLTEITEDPTFVADEHYHAGDEVQGTVVKTDDGQGNIVLSMKQAFQMLSWEKLKACKDNETVLHVHVSSAVNGGVIAFAEGLRGFIPASQLSLTYVEDLNTFVGKDLDVNVITIDQEKNKLVLSAKKVEQKRKEEELNSRKARLVPGTIFEGRVESIMPYGAFIDLGNGLSGLLHISRISQKRLNNPSEVLKEGQEVKVKLLNVKDGKLSLSMKEFEEVTNVEADAEETFEYHDEGEATTSLASLFANIKL
ncbi:MAG: S1 RNA-binding domain-containing protein [Lachnospiraceae bacterium]|nr:S1 RNA-binding domain-containing protein [Lachnospiraceae bacterium]MCR4684153.1 S1 RNA-binding domain-containing protein [Lachnospiraceae bacterium]